MERPQQPYRYLCVLDFEATCERNSPPPRPQEIIEFPVVLLDTHTLTVVDEFHQYVRPIHHPKLTDFCTELTGITQAQVDAGVTFPVCMELLRVWLVKNGLLADHGAPADTATHAWLSVSCGKWDHDTMLPEQCATSGMRLPDYFRQACDIKQVFDHVDHSRKKFSMPMMLRRLGLELVGRHHSGIDDARNITRIAIELIRRGAVFEPNWFLQVGARKKQGNPRPPKKAE